MQNTRALSAESVAAFFSYLANGGAIRVYATGASAINPVTGKADFCPLPVATTRPLAHLARGA